MPYRKISELPDPLKKHLPKHAQEIYMEAFNHAWNQYKDPKKRRLGGSQDEAAHRVAWSAVKKQYHKSPDGNWTKGHLT